MNEQVINELLEQLKQNLKKVESAREQVEKTVRAYEALAEDVRHYTEELSFIVQNTRIMISQLEEIKEKFLDNISVRIIEVIQKAVNEICTVIDSKSHNILDVINKRADSLDSAITLLQNHANEIKEQVNLAITKLDAITNILQALDEREKKHFSDIEKHIIDQQNMISSEFVSVRKQNIIFFVVNIVLIIVLALLIIFNMM